MCVSFGLLNVKVVLVLDDTFDRLMTARHLSTYAWCQMNGWAVCNNTKWHCVSISLSPNLPSQKIKKGQPKYARSGVTVSSNKNDVIAFESADVGNRQNLKPPKNHLSSGVVSLPCSLGRRAAHHTTHTHTTHTLTPLTPPTLL
jgi:hypothetical protein